MAKNYHKIGNKQGKPAYRTSSSFRARKSIQKLERSQREYPQNLRVKRWEVFKQGRKSKKMI